MRRIQSRILGMAMAMICLSACEPMKTSRGHIEAQDLIEQIKVGSTDKEAVQKLLGSPSSISEFGEETWYYITVQKEAYGFFKPEITEQHITEIRFDDQDIVSATSNYELGDSKQVAIIEDITPTEGHSLTFIEQMLGNVGKFNKDRDRTLNPGNTRR